MKVDNVVCKTNSNNGIEIYSVPEPYLYYHNNYLLLYILTLNPMMTTLMNIVIICIYVYTCTVVLSYTVAPNPILEMENSLRDQIDLDLEYEDHCDYIGMEDLSQISTYNSTLNVTHLNIRGIIGKQTDLLKILNGYNGKTITHLATINETWLTCQNKNKLKINGYKCISKERVGRKGGGVCILSHDSLYYTELTEINDI